MKNIKIEKTGLCIFLLALPLILILILSIVLAATIPAVANAGDEWMTISTVIAVVAIILIFVYLYRLGPALMALILIARIKKSADYDDESIHTTTLGEFIKSTRTPLSEDEVKALQDNEPTDAQSEDTQTNGDENDDSTSDKDDNGQ